MSVLLKMTRAGFIYECRECGLQFVDDKSIEAGHDCEALS